MKFFDGFKAFMSHYSFVYRNDSLIIFSCNIAYLKEFQPTSDFETLSYQPATSTVKVKYMPKSSEMENIILKSRCSTLGQLNSDIWLITHVLGLERWFSS